MTQAEAKSTAHNTREKLLDVAERLFAEHGFDAVSVRAILREAGLRNQSALQYHFGDREKLISAIQGRRVKQLEQKRRELMAEVLALDRELELFTGEHPQPERPREESDVDLLSLEGVGGGGGLNYIFHQFLLLIFGLISRS